MKKVTTALSAGVFTFACLGLCSGAAVKVRCRQADRRTVDDGEQGRGKAVAGPLRAAAA